MTPATVEALLTDALVDAGVVGIDEAMEQPIINKAFTQANRLLAQWQRRRYLVYTLHDYSFVSTGVEFYTVGVGQNFNIDPRPNKLESAFLRQLATGGGQSIDWPLEIIASRENYNQIILKTLGTFSNSIYYNPKWPIGHLFPWPIPQATIYELHATFMETLTSFATLQTSINLPPEYEFALEWNLAMIFRASFQMPADPEVNKLARAGLNTIRLANSSVPTLTLPRVLRPQGGYAYNYKADQP